MTRLFACLLTLIVISAAIARAAEPEVVYLWDGVAPGSEGQTGEEIVRLSDSGERIVSNVHRPSLTVYVPTETTAIAPAVLIVPGGGHREIWTDHEGHNVARWLSERGVAAFILKYRLPRQEGSPYTIEHEVADGKRALRLMRHRAADWRIDPKRIGMIGFSAGGELVARVAVAAEEGDPDAADPIERQSARPAFQALMYPAHPELIQPPTDAPPAFLCWGFEDFPMISDGMGSVYTRFRDAKVPVEMHVYADAGHGFGLRAKDTSPAGKWIDRFYEWLGSQGLLMPQEFNYSGDPLAVGADPAEIAEMDALLQSFVDEQKLNSVVGFVAKGGDVVYEKAFGWKDVENRVPATVDDYYVLFSQTKAITTVAFMTLVEQGLVAIDDPVSKYFPEIPDQVVTKVNEDGSYETRPVESPMTFVHLMTHTSGLGAGLVRDIRRAERKGSGAPMGFGGAVPEKTPDGQHSGGGNPESKYLEEEMLALAKYPLGADPGTHWNYHVSTNMLGYLVERISGKPLRDYVKESILDPLGMDDTDWYYEPNALGRFVKPYRVVDGALQPGSTLYSEGAVSERQTYAEGAIGLNGPIQDYAKFCQMLLNKGKFNGHRILKSDTVELMTTINRLPPDSGAEEGFQFGFGFELHPEKKPVPAVSDSAFAWGGLFGTAYIIDPENDLIALFYMNMYNPEPMYPKFLAQAYALFDSSDARRTEASGAAEVVLEKGGTGPYSAIVTEDASLPGMTIYRPSNLASFGKSQKLPILLWGNGACVNTTEEHKLFLNEIASHGYLILAIGLLDRLDLRDEISNQKTHSSQLIEALDWILEQNDSTSSPFFGKVDPAQVAAMGMSCGGLQAIEISGDPRIRTTVVCNSGVLKDPSPMRGMPALNKEALKSYHGPVLYLMGGQSDIAYNNAMDDFALVDHVPIIMTNLDVGHGGTYGKPHGGEYSPVALAWLDWQLKGKEDASKMFLGKDSTLARDPDWTVELKNFDSTK